MLNCLTKAKMVRRYNGIQTMVGEDAVFKSVANIATGYDRGRYRGGQ
jgi:hypothetical protein